MVGRVRSRREASGILPPWILCRLSGAEGLLEKSEGCPGGPFRTKEPFLQSVDAGENDLWLTIHPYSFLS